MKQCKKCKEVKDIIEFMKDKRYENGCRDLCIKCNYFLKLQNVDSKIKLEEKNCKMCNRIKLIEDFSKDKFSKDGFANSCKDCRKLYYNLNKHKFNRSTYLKKYRESYKEVRNKKNKIKRKSDPIFALSSAIRSRISESLKNNRFYKKSNTQEILGCSFEEFKIYIESKFEHWMTWENRGLFNGELNYGWDIDHIIPLSSANSEEEIIKLNHFTNLQPLCSYKNRHIKRDLFIS